MCIVVSEKGRINSIASIRKGWRKRPDICKEGRGVRRAFNSLDLLMEKQSITPTSPSTAVPSLLAPGNSFMEDSFPRTGVRWGMV